MTAEEIRVASELERTWSRARGPMSWFRQIDHQSIGRRFIVTAFVWFALGGVLALLMRTQLARPASEFLSNDQYNQIFTVHGVTMMFLFAVPVMEAVAVFVIPLMVGSRSMAFPRSVAFAYYLNLFAGIFLYTSLILNMGPDVGWFAYVPLAGPEFGIGKRVDVWAQIVNFTELSALIVATQTIVTILKHRAPGMSLNRMPLYVWSMLVASVMIVFAMPAVMTGSNFLALDRLVGTHLFNVPEGGDVLLWQHLFWIFGHPEVYILILPAFGIVSEVLPTFSRKPIFGYTAVVFTNYDPSAMMDVTRRIQGLVVR